MSTMIQTRSMKAATLLAGLLLASCSETPEPRVEGPYTAILTCVHDGRHYNVRGCFQDSGVKITTPNGARIYESSRFINAGDSVRYTLPPGSRLQARNSHEVLVLRLRVYDENDEVVFRGGAGEYDVIDYIR